MRALVRTCEGVVELDLETGIVLESDAAVDHERLDLALPRLVAAAACGTTIVALVERRPPLLVSRDSGATWSEAGAGLPAGYDVAIDPDDPDRVLYAARNRVHLSTDGGRFWRAIEPELPDIEAVAWAQPS